MTKGKGKAFPAAADRKVQVEGKPGETEAQAIARVMVGPFIRHGIVAKGLADRMAGKLPGDPGFDARRNLSP